MIRKRQLFIFAIPLLLVACQVNSSADAGSVDQDGPFNADLAEALGADEYGMRSYTLVLLSSGEADITDETELARLQQQHLANIQKLADRGHLALAGPFYNTETYRGLFILATDDLNEAESWVNTDPAIAAGLLQSEFLPWYGSAALMEVSKLHKFIEQAQP